MTEDKLQPAERLRLEALAQAIALVGPQIGHTVAHARSGREGVPVLRLLQVADTFAAFIADGDPSLAVDVRLTIEKEPDKALWEVMADQYEGLPDVQRDAFRDRLELEHVEPAQHADRD